MATATATRGRKTGSAVDPNETPRDRFKRLGTGRMNKAITGIRGVAQLANQNRYEYTDEDVAKVTDALQAETKAAISALQARKAPIASSFTLD
jgi:hypothetical protein